MSAHTHTGDLPPVAWQISTSSSSTGSQCLEAGPLLDDSGRVALRHSQDRTGPVIVFTAAEWSAFIDGAKAGEFDFGSRQAQEAAGR